MTNEQLQFQISQYLDGSLAEADRAELELRLKTDPEARRILAEYRRINALFDAALPVPDVDWDRLSRKISAAVDTAVPEELVATERPAARPWSSLVRPVVYVAGLLIAVTAAFLLWPRGQQELASNVTKAVPSPLAEVAVLVAPRPIGAAVSEIEIAPAQEVADFGVYPADVTMQAPARVAIAGLPVYVDESLSIQ